MSKSGVCPYHIVLAEDHARFRQVIKSLIEANAGLKVVGEVEDGLKLLELLQETVPDLIILDISMPHLHGLEATRRIKQHFPEIKVLILTLHKCREYFRQAMLAGAEGYLLKEQADRELIPAIKKILGGGSYIPQGSLAKWV